MLSCDFVFCYVVLSRRMCYIVVCYVIVLTPYCMISSYSILDCTIPHYILLYRSILRLMDKILHDPKDPKLWELWYIPYNG